MSNYDLIAQLIELASRESDAHKAEQRERGCYWYTGHKNKAKRAITMARELLLEASKELDKPCNTK